MKKNILIFIVFVLVFSMCGCSTKEENTNSNSSVNSNIIINNSSKPSSFKHELNSKKIDIDLKNLSKVELAAKVQELLIRPDNYLDKRIRISGIFFSSYNENTKEMNYFLIGSDGISDEPWMLPIKIEKESLKYPDKTAQIEIIGLFKSFIRDKYISIEEIKLLS